MKTLLSLAILVAAALAVQADTLSFTSGVVSNYSNVTLNLQGPTNATCQVERLNRTNQTWDSVGTLTLNSSGAGAFSTSLDGGYGYFRSKTTNGAYLSTNAFGAVTGYLGQEWSMIGNPFAATTVSGLIPGPANGTTVYRYDGTNGFVTATYDTDLGGWDTNMPVAQLEGALVSVPTNTVRYLVSGLFTTNSLSKSIPSGDSILCSPLYKLTVVSAWQIDELNTNKLGGDSLLPVQSSGYSPQCTINRMIDTSGNYRTYTLTTNNVWQTSGTNTVVPLHLTEGFWIKKPVSATWTIGLTIW